LFLSSGQDFGILRTIYGFFQENIYNGSCDNDYEDYDDDDAADAADTADAADAADDDDEDDVEDDDDESNDTWSHSTTQSPLAPHPNLRLLTQEVCQLSCPVLSSKVSFWITTL